MASTLPDSNTRPAVDPGPGVAGCSSRYLVKASVWLAPALARKRKTSPSRTQIVPPSAPQSSTADEMSVPNTACRSKAERLMTFSTSEVAV